MRRWSAWFVVVPLMLAGTEAAHALAYRLVYPGATVRWQALASTGHGYLGWFPLLAGIGGAIALTGLAGGVADAARRGPARPVPAWAFGLLPLVGFTLQEFLERWVALGGFPWWMVEQPTFRVGLLLQLPFALLAWAISHLLLRSARRLGFALRPGPPPYSLDGLPVRRYAVAVGTVRRSRPRGSRAVRGPPSPAWAPLPCP